MKNHGRSISLDQGDLYFRDQEGYLVISHDQFPGGGSMHRVYRSTHQWASEHGSIEVEDDFRFHSTLHGQDFRVYEKLDTKAGIGYISGR